MAERFDVSRRTFLTSGSAALATLLVGCSDPELSEIAVPDDLHVVVVGAGPAGLTAAHLLNQVGVSFEVLEANPTHGGRTRHVLDFVDFPIPMGAEWVHVEAGVLDEIVNDEAVDVDIELVAYESSDSYAYYDGELTRSSLGRYDDLKFRDSSWLDFFNRFIVPGIGDRIRYDTPVVAIDYSTSPVRVTATDGSEFQADAVIVTAPLRILQRRDIAFEPALPPERIDAIDSATVWSGFKAFFEFEEQFYPTLLETPESDTRNGQLAFYDAAYGQVSDRNVLGLFTVGAPAERYQALSDEAFAKTVLAELDEMFDGAATRTYLQHITQNWNQEPYAGAAYLADHASVSTSRELSFPLDERLYFAGDAYTRFADWSSVHTAARSAADTVAELLIHRR